VSQKSVSFEHSIPVIQKITFNRRLFAIKVAYATRMGVHPPAVKLCSWVSRKIRQYHITDLRVSQR